jgi:N-acyl-D-aspartate/D-glutamate deacylase
MSYFMTETKLTLIKNGKIIDGTGNPWFKADLLIENAKIKKIDPDIDDIDVD